MKRVVAIVGVAQLLLFRALAFAQDRAPVPTEGAPSDTPFTDYTASAVSYMLLIGVLITVLLLGAFLVLNLGLMSKRPEDRVGGRNPSDVGVLKHTVWPEEANDRRTLPAEEEEEPVRPGLERGDRETEKRERVSHKTQS